MSRFDEIDAAATAAIGRQLSERVVWRPMAPKSRGRYAGEGTVDPARPARELVGIVTWLNTRQVVGTSTSLQGALGGNIGMSTVCLDLETSQFDDPDQRPVKDDLFELPEDDKANLVEVVRVVSDGSAMIQLYCAVVS